MSFSLTPGARRRRDPASTRLLALAAVLAACGAPSARGGGPASGARGRGVPVRLETVTSREVVDASEYVASTRSRRAITLQPQVAGQITQILVHAGDTVAARTPLIQIDPSRQQATVGSAVAAAAQARAQQAAAEEALRSLEGSRAARVANLELARHDLARTQTLFAANAVTQQQLDQARNAFEAAQSALVALDAQIASQRGAVGAARAAVGGAAAATEAQRVQLGYFRVEAPIAGRVGDIPVHVGDYVTPTTTLTTVVQDAALEVYINVPIERAPALRVGLPVELRDEADATLARGTIGFVAPEVDPATQSVLAKVAFPPSTAALRVGQYVRARIVWSTRPGLRVPVTAVVRQAAQPFVFVAEPARGAHGGGLVARQRPVELGPIDGNDYVVRGGLHAGDRVVTEGGMRLADGVPLAPQS